MKNYNKIIALILILSVIFLSGGCSKIKLKTFKEDGNSNKSAYDVNDNIGKDNEENGTDTENNTDNTANSENSETQNILSSNNNGTTGDVTPVPTAIQPTDNIELLIYIVNSSAELEAVPALVPAGTEITPQLIVDTVVDSMADQSLVIGVESVTTDGDTVIVSFYSDKPPLKDVGAGYEEAILNAIAQSITENLDDYNKVIYRVEGGPYVSGHMEFGINEVYFEDSN